MKFVVDSFDSLIKQIYGNQDEALRKIFQATPDRTTMIVLDDESLPQALVVYKTTPDDEYNQGYDSLEIKTFIVSGRKRSGFGSFMMKELLAITHPHSLRVTVNVTKPEVSKFFHHYGFHSTTLKTRWNDEVLFLRRT